MVGEPKEIQRVEIIKPMLINATIPHRGQFINPNRLLACIRFDPELSSEDATKLLGTNIPQDHQYIEMLKLIMKGPRL